jgi:Flp pilus assembly protein TadG
MNKVLFFGLWFISYFLFMFYALDVGIMNITSTDNDDAVEMAARTAISQSINRGELRVRERLTIDPDVAQATFLKSYAKNASYNHPNTLRKIDFYNISSEPPMIAVEVTTATDSYVKNYFKQVEGPQSGQKNFSNKRHVVIYEAKSTNIPPEGGVQ